MWTQIVGKVRLVQMPWLNHSWHVTLYVTARGLTTSVIPYGPRGLQIDFDFVEHQLRIQSSDGATETIPLRPQSVHEFYDTFFQALGRIGFDIKISTTPNEVIEAIPFTADERHASYDPDYANRFWRIVFQTHRVFTDFRSRFLGKCSPVHFFWGSFDMAVTRFSGRPAPPHPGGVPHLPDRVAREAYSHEVSSCGFWPGGEAMPDPVFYSYAYPMPDGFEKTKVCPQTAYWSDQLREFLLPYDAVRTAKNPDEVLLEFLQSSYEAAADLGKWDRGALERRTESPAAP
jgi:hypothetical protein